MRKFSVILAFTLLVLAKSSFANAGILVEESPPVVCTHQGQMKVSYYSAIMYYDALKDIGKLISEGELDSRRQSNVNSSSKLLRMHLFRAYTRQWGVVSQYRVMVPIEDDMAGQVTLDYCQAFTLHFLFLGLEELEPRYVSGEVLDSSDASLLLGLVEEHRAISKFLNLEPAPAYEKLVKSLAFQLKAGSFPKKLEARASTFLQAEGAMVQR